MRKFLFILTCLIFFPFVPENANAEETYYSDKVWTITFNMELDPDTVNNETIFIKNNADQTLNNVQLTLDNPKKQVYVDALDEYLPGEYTLHISDQVKSKNGKYLKTPVLKNFTIISNEPITILKESQLNDAEEKLFQNWRVYFEEEMIRRWNREESRGAYYLGEDLYIVTTGIKSHGGYGIRITKTETSWEQVFVYIEDVQPSSDPDIAYPDIIDYPFLIIKSNLPPYTTLSFLIDKDIMSIKDVPISNPRITALDVEQEVVTISNHSSFEVDMTGWTLMSTEGSQTFTFPDGYILKPWNPVYISSDPNVTDNPSSTLKWTGSNIWNNNGDTVQLYNAEGELVNEIGW